MLGEAPAPQCSSAPASPVAKSLSQRPPTWLQSLLWVSEGGGDPPSPASPISVLQMFVFEQELKAGVASSAPKGNRL